jgi:hypothetical protein
LLAYGKSNSLPMFYRLGKDVPRLFEVVAGVSEAINLRSVFGPFLDPVVVTLVGDDWINGFIGRLRHTLQIYLIQYSTPAHDNGVRGEAFRATRNGLAARNHLEPILSV